MKTINERIGHIIEVLDITPYEFSKKMGNKRADTLYNIIKNIETQPSQKTLNKIKEHFPEINYLWLITGEGNVLVDEENVSNQKNINLVEEPKSDYKKIIPNNKVPYYDVDFVAGFLSVENNSQIVPDSYISHPFFKGCDYVVRASGQSMAKVICHGDAIGLIKVENWIEFFPFGEIYAIVTKDGFRMIKIITKGETEEYFTLISKPTDSKKDEFPPQQIKKTSILSIFKVQASSHLF